MCLCVSQVRVWAIGVCCQVPEWIDLNTSLIHSVTNSESLGASSTRGSSYSLVGMCIVWVSDVWGKGMSVHLPVSGWDICHLASVLLVFWATAAPLSVDRPWQFRGESIG